MKIDDYRRAIEHISPDEDLEERLRKKVMNRNVSEKAYRVWAAAILAVCVLAPAIVILALLAMRDAGDPRSAAIVTGTPTASPEHSRQIVYAQTASGLAMSECVPEGGGIYLAMNTDEEAMLSDPEYWDVLFSVMIFPYHLEEYYGEAYTGFMLDGWTAEALRVRIDTLASECETIWGACIGKGEEEPPEVEWYDPRDAAQRALFDPEGKYSWLTEYGGRLPVSLPEQWYEMTDEVLRLEAEEVRLIHARTLYFCEREAERLQAKGVTAEAVSLLDGSLIFVHAVVSQEQIRALPYDGAIGYYIKLAPANLSEITEMMAMDE